MTASQDRNELAGLLDGFAEQVPKASSAVVVSGDGFVLATSRDIGRDTAEQLAAVTSGLTSLTSGAAACFRAGVVRQVAVEMTKGYLFVTAIGEGTTLAVMCQPDCDVGRIGHEVSRLVTRLEPALTPERRAALAPAPPF